MTAARGAEWALGPTERSAQSVEPPQSTPTPRLATRSKIHPRLQTDEINIGAGNGIRTRDFDLGKVALYH